MKKIFILCLSICIAISSLLCFASCSEDNSSNTQTQLEQTKAYNSYVVY